ncbi:hypothetical protein D1007_23816 [Hordeum vulgare]|nr:hypothetical protein D1007_23816 [Hordeum vulgare]
MDFPLLRQLTLHGVTLMEEALRAVLSGCTALESLLLAEIVGAPCLRISSPSLRSIGFCAPWDKQASADVNANVGEMVIDDCPHLQRLLPLNPDHGPATIRVIRAPKLEDTLGVSLTTTMHTVKVLCLDHVGPDLDRVLRFLKCFPCLERLYITLEPRKCTLQLSNEEIRTQNNMKNMRKYASLDDPIKCLEHHLKKVALKVYYGVGPEVDFARFFVLNSKVLDRMEFGFDITAIDGPWDEWRVNRWRSNQNKQLRIEDRSSRDARFEFKMFGRTSFKDFKKCTHDLSTADPFDTSFLEGYVAL